MSMSSIMGQPATIKSTRLYSPKVIFYPGSKMICYLSRQDTMVKVLRIQHLIRYSRKTSLILEILQIGQHAHDTLNIL